MEQEHERRYILHVLYVNTINRGSYVEMNEDIRSGSPIEVIEELNPVYNVHFRVKLPKEISRITLEPQGKEIPVVKNDGRYEFVLEQLTCHQMIVFHE